MLPANINHLKKVVLWGGGASVLLAAASLLRFTPLVGISIIAGALLGIFNLYSIVKLVEALAGAAAAGAMTGKASKALTLVFHLFNIALIAVALVVLIWNHLINLFAVLAGFTIVLLSNLAAGMSGLAKNPDKTG